MPGIEHVFYSGCMAAGGYGRGAGIPLKDRVRVDQGSEDSATPAIAAAPEHRALAEGVGQGLGLHRDARHGDQQGGNCWQVHVCRLMICAVSAGGG